MKRKVIGIFLMLSLLTGCSGTSEQKVPKLLDNKSVIAATWTVQRGTISNAKTGVGVGTYKMDSYSFKS